MYAHMTVSSIQAVWKTRLKWVFILGGITSIITLGTIGIDHGFDSVVIASLVFLCLVTAGLILWYNEAVEENSE